MITINGVTYYGEEAERRSIGLLRQALEPEYSRNPEAKIVLQDEPPREEGNND